MIWLTRFNIQSLVQSISRHHCSSNVCLYCGICLERNDLNANKRLPITSLKGFSFKLKKTNVCYAIKKSLCDHVLALIESKYWRSNDHCILDFSLTLAQRSINGFEIGSVQTQHLQGISFTESSIQRSSISQRVACDPTGKRSTQTSIN